MNKEDYIYDACDALMHLEEFNLLNIKFSVFYFQANYSDYFYNKKKREEVLAWLVATLPIKNKLVYRIKLCDRLLLDKIFTSEELNGLI